MKSNDSFATIAEVLETANEVVLFPHVNVDGDALGSCVAMARALRQRNKNCMVVLEDEIPDNLRFLAGDYTCSAEEWEEKNIDAPDVVMCLDCSETSRFPGREEIFAKGKTSVCVDHHATGAPVCDYNYIDPSAAATGELVYLLLQEMGAPLDSAICEALFAAITTDTGNFQYSNTTKQTHEIAAALYEVGFDANAVSVKLYESQSLAKLRISAKALDTMEILGDGKIAIAYVTDAMLQETGAKSGDTDSVVGTLRSIDGVQIAIFLKEKEENLIRASLRAKDQGDVAAIAKQYDGGGHVKAAGATLHMPLEQALADIKEKALASLMEKED